MADSSVQAVESTDLQFLEWMEGFTDLEKATEGNQTIQRIVDTQYQCLKFKEVFKDLELAGSLIDLASKSAGQEPCSVSILEVLTKYQVVVAESAVQSKVCVEASTKVVKAHKAIRKKFKENKPLKALEDWAKISEVAKKMQEATEITVKKFDELVVWGEKALLHVQDCLIETTFLQVRTFWKSVSDHCKELQDPTKDVEFLVKVLECGWDKSKVRDQWEISLAGWAALGSVNIQAYRSLEKAGVSVDEKVSELTRKTAKEVRDMALKLGMQVEKAAEEAEKLIANEMTG